MERVALALFEFEHPGLGWANGTQADREYSLGAARAALAALQQEPRRSHQETDADGRTYTVQDGRGEPVPLTPEEAEKVYAGLEYAGWTFRSDAPSHIILSKLRALAEEEE